MRLWLLVSPTADRYVKETYDKIKSGVDFYWTGTKLLGNDVGYALTLVSKAVQVCAFPTRVTGTSSTAEISVHCLVGSYHREVSPSLKFIYCPPPKFRPPRSNVPSAVSK